jgi:hypothetical protein
MEEQEVGPFVDELPEPGIDPAKEFWTTQMTKKNKQVVAYRYFQMEHYLSGPQSLKSRSSAKNHWLTAILL